VGTLSLDDFNPDARDAALWTRARLSESSISWLLRLPPMRVVTGFDITLVHGSPVDPIWDYVFSTSGARSAFDALGTRHCFNGHTHVPLLYQEAKPGGGIVEERPFIGRPTRLLRGRFLVNPGSVGQPRDGDPRASFCILDTGTMAVTNHRVDYDIARTQRGMKVAGLPTGLIERLGFGR
ncbi:MAG: metallophosphoesterase family protein, partial [Spirochaetota bacterium]